MTILTNILLLTALTAYLLIVGFVFTGQMNDILKGYHFRPKDTAPDDDYEVLIGGEGELAILFEEKLKAFMSESDSKISSIRQYSDHRTKSRRR